MTVVVAVGLQWKNAARAPAVMIRCRRLPEQSCIPLDRIRLVGPTHGKSSKWQVAGPGVFVNVGRSVMRRWVRTAPWWRHGGRACAIATSVTPSLSTCLGTAVPAAAGEPLLYIKIATVMQYRVKPLPILFAINDRTSRVWYCLELGRKEMGEFREN